MGSEVSKHMLNSVSQSVCLSLLADKDIKFSATAQSQIYLFADMMIMHKLSEMISKPQVSAFIYEFFLVMVSLHSSRTVTTIKIDMEFKGK